MRTKEIVEGLLYEADNSAAMMKKLRICHIINDSDRNWISKGHSEFYFLENFKNPYFIEVIDKQIYVYLIGDETKGKNYSILSIEGNTTSLLTMSKSALIDHIKESLKECRNQFLPSGLSQRIIFIGKTSGDKVTENDLDIDGDGNDDIFIFNRQAQDDNILKKSKWSLGTDIYSAAQPEYTTSALEIIRECLKELDE